MNDSEPRPSGVPPAEEPIDALLREFFRNEMPRELRALPDRPLPPAADRAWPQDRAWKAVSHEPRLVEVVRGSPAGTRSNAAARAGMAVAGAALLLAVWGLAGPAERDGRPGADVMAESTAHGGDLISGPGALPSAADDAVARRSAPVLDEPEEDEWPLATIAPLRKRFDTLDGPVELRVDVRIERVRFGDPASGNEVEMDFPELAIEVFPIDD